MYIRTYVPLLAGTRVLPAVSYLPPQDGSRLAPPSPHPRMCAIRLLAYWLLAMS